MKIRVFLLLAVLFLSGCNKEYPYLWVVIENPAPYYAGNELSIRYEFVSETDPQRCRIKLFETSVSPEYLIYDNEDKEIRTSGTILTPPLNSGDYRLEFMPLSDRDGEVSELPFLSEILYFTVSP